MNDNASETNGNGSDRDSRQFALQRIYMKDLSFEVPSAPAIFSEQQVDPEIQLNLKNSHSGLGNDSGWVITGTGADVVLDGIVVPEPSLALLVGVGLLLLGSLAPRPAQSSAKRSR